ncbi:MAG: baseplate J/gp47 family protein [Acetobacteraceae bacterium]|nr:baseplate J/gp47 family protein [Acetobacteraceae bacterium]
MALQLQDFPTLVKTQASAVTASCQQLVDMTVGSVTRALLEANASIGLWIQWLIVQVLGATRASTSTGADLDTWVADFGMARFQATSAVGSATFSRYTAGLATSVPAGTLVRTGLGENDQVFMVVADPSNPKWVGNGYSVGASDISVPTRIVAQTPGAGGNVIAGAVTLLANAIPGIDTVTNELPTAGGLDAESDPALRRRFAGFLDSRNRATSQAVGFAIASVRQGLSFTIAERIDASGAVRPGHFTVTVDDGTGTPSNDLIASVAAAVDAVRPIGGTFSVRPPFVMPTSVQMQAVGPATAVSNARAAVLAHIAALPIGAPLTLTRLYQVAYSADTSITNLSGALINGASADLVPPVFGLLRPSTIVVHS